MRLNLFAPCLLLALASSALFADDFPTTGGGAGLSGSGVLTATNQGGGVYGITGVSGDGVLGLVGTQPGYRSNDNLLMPDAGTVLDGNGFAFLDLMGDTGYTVDIFASGAQAYSAWVKDTDGIEQEIAVDFSLGQPSEMMAFRALAAEPIGTSRRFGYEFAQTVATTPEPTSVALLGTGFLGLAGVLRRRRK